MNKTSGILRSILSALKRFAHKDREDKADLPGTVFSDRISELTGRPVGHPGIYREAMRHRSIARGQADIELESNERLEFLGDAILGLIVSQYLYKKYPHENEGFLTRMRSKLVNGPMLATFARRIDLGRHILMSENTAQTNGRNNETILSDAFEALVGALYLDQGYPAAETFVLETIHSTIELETVLAEQNNYKSRLLEFAQAQGWSQPVYRLIHTEGPGHDREFTVEVLINNEAYGMGTARNKKKAEQEAAEQALHTIQKQHPGNTG